jgi:hypothetical protein
MIFTELLLQSCSLAVIKEKRKGKMGSEKGNDILKEAFDCKKAKNLYVK